MASSPVTRRQFVRRSSGVVFGLAAGAGFAGCGSSGSNSSASSSGGGGSTGSPLLDEIKKRGYVRLGVSSNEPPYSLIKPDGTVTGVEPDIATAAFAKLGVTEAKGVAVPFEAMIPALQANRFDAIAGALFMNQTRCKTIRFSEPDVVSTQSFAVPVGNPHNIDTLKAAVQAKLKIGVLPGTFQENILKARGIPSSQMLELADQRSGAEAVQNGRVDVFIAPTDTLKSLVKTGSKVDITPPLSDFPISGGGLGFKQEDAKLVDLYNRQLDALKANGDFAKILRRWGFPPKITMKTTTAQLCKNPG